MNEKELNETIARLYAEIDMLRARSDVLAIALKRTVLASHDPEQTLDAITASLDISNVKALYSSAPTEAYLAAFDAAVQTISKWHGALPRAAQ